MCFSFDPQQRKGIARRRQQTRDYRLAMRLSTLLWRDDDKTESEIAHLLGLCERTVRNWLRLYRKKGVDALRTLHCAWVVVSQDDRLPLQGPPRQAGGVRPEVRGRPPGGGRDQTAVARVLDHLEDYREELTALMTERFHLVPEIPAEAVPVWGS